MESPATPWLEASLANVHRSVARIALQDVEALLGLVSDDRPLSEQLHPRHAIDASTFCLSNKELLEVVRRSLLRKLGRS